MHYEATIAILLLLPFFRPRLPNCAPLSIPHHILCLSKALLHRPVVISLRRILDELAIRASMDSLAVVTLTRQLRVMEYLE